MTFQEFGFTRAARRLQQSFNRLWLHNYLAFFLRFSGFFLLGLIVYLHFVFSSITHEPLTIGPWMLGYLIYLTFLEYLNYKKVSFYDLDWFIIFRILFNILFFSWLMNLAPLMRGILAFTYIVPYILSIVYFPQKKLLLLFVYIFSVFGIIISSIVLDLNDPLTPWQMVVIASALGITLIILQHIYGKLLNVPEGLSDIIKRLQGTLDLTDIVGQISEGVLMITEAEGLFILIVDPEDLSYINHKVLGFHLSPSFEMDDLISQCNAIQNGKGYGNDDLDETSDKAYFNQFFNPAPRAIMIEPILGTKKEVLGLIMVGNLSSSQFDGLKKKYFKQFCANASVAIETNLIYRKARLSLLGRKKATEQLLEVEEEGEIMRVLVEQASLLISSADGCVYHQYQSDTGHLVAQGGIKPLENGKLVPWAASYTDFLNLGNSIMHMGEGIAGHALKKGKIIVVDDVNRHSWFQRSAQKDKFISLMSAPIIDPSDNLPLGTLSVHSKQKAAFTSEDQTTLNYLAKQGAISIKRVKKSEEGKFLGSMLKDIFGSAMEIDFEGGEKLVTQQLAEIALRILPFGMVRIRYYDPVTMDLITVAALGYPQEDQELLIGNRLPWAELKKYLKPEYSVERSFLIPSNAPGWQEFAKKFLYIPKTISKVNATWDVFDAFFTPLVSEKGDPIGYIAWDQPENSLRPHKKIVEAIGAFASMAGWSIDLVRAYHRITEQRSLIKRLLASTTEKMETTKDKNILGDVAVKIGSEHLHTEACSLFMVIGNEIELTNSTYLKNTSYINGRKQIKAEARGGLSSWVAATQKPLYFNSPTDYQTFSGWAGETEQLKFLPSKSCINLLLVPIMGHKNKCLGVLSFENKIEEGKIVNFTNYDTQKAINLAEEFGLSLGLAEQINNAREIDQQMLEDDLHEIRNKFFYGIQISSETAMYWLENKNIKKVKPHLRKTLENSYTILDELYNLHNLAQRKYYEIDDFKIALNLIADNFIHTFTPNNYSYKKNRERVRIDCPREIKLTPALRYSFIRITSGALMNSIKHSGFLDNSDVEINITINQDDNSIILNIEDNGCGAKDIKPGYGIGRMYYLERFMKSKGVDVNLKIDTSERDGTSVKLVANLLQKENGNV